jgi:hypothetical protein
VIVDNSLQTLPEGFPAEIHQQPDRLPRQSQIGEKLLTMYRREALGRLDLYDQFFLDKQVGTKAVAQMHPFEFDRDRLLPFHTEATAHEARLQNGFINGFEQARAKLFMNIDSAIDGNRRYFLDMHRQAPPLASPIFGASSSIASSMQNVDGADKRSARRCNLSSKLRVDEGWGVTSLVLRAFAPSREP